MALRRAEIETAAHHERAGLILRVPRPFRAIGGRTDSPGSKYRVDREDADELRLWMERNER